RQYSSHRDMQAEIASRTSLRPRTRRAGVAILHARTAVVHPAGSSFRLSKNAVFPAVASATMGMCT
ncbi:hypothetical protein LLE87_29900, partial [Paenibacillus polymyxa]|nr:hypothetical protein [Paenibacillus polymyxa]